MYPLIIFRIYALKRPTAPINRRFHFVFLIVGDRREEVNACYLFYAVDRYRHRFQRIIFIIPILEKKSDTLIAFLRMITQYLIKGFGYRNPVFPNRFISPVMTGPVTIKSEPLSNAHKRHCSSRSFHMPRFNFGFAGRYCSGKKTRAWLLQTISYRLPELNGHDRSRNAYNLRSSPSNLSPAGRVQTY